MNFYRVIRTWEIETVVLGGLASGDGAHILWTTVSIILMPCIYDLIVQGSTLSVARLPGAGRSCIGAGTT